jgi:HPt (histidine-containing phosphotransfer) domain-containing protein
MENITILDRAHLAKYTLGDAALEREVLDLFIGQMPVTVASLRSSNDAQSWLRAAHTIKGSARAVGAWKLAEVAARAESVASEPGSWAELINDIAVAVQEVSGRIAVMELEPA